MEVGKVNYTAFKFSLMLRNKCNVNVGIFAATCTNY